MCLSESIHVTFLSVNYSSQLIVPSSPLWFVILERSHRTLGCRLSHQRGIEHAQRLVSGMLCRTGRCATEWKQTRMRRWGAESTKARQEIDCSKGCFEFNSAPPTPMNIHIHPKPQCDLTRKQGLYRCIVRLWGGHMGLGWALCLWTEDKTWESQRGRTGDNRGRVMGL